jgi:hypothetical protein
LKHRWMAGLACLHRLHHLRVRGLRAGELLM